MVTATNGQSENFEYTSNCLLPKPLEQEVLNSDPKQYHRDWFSWANTYFGEMILTLLKKHSHLLT